jgi:CHAT domain-containing protein/tetratricopeptide (TPR) repeat protein
VLIGYIKNTTGIAVAIQLFALILALGISGQDTVKEQDLALTYLEQGNKDFSAGRFAEALVSFRKALPLLRSSNRDADAAVCLFDIAASEQNLKQHRESIRSYQEALPLLIKANFQADQAMALVNIGIQFRELQDPTSSIDFLKQALLLFEKLGDTAKEADTAYYLADSHLDIDDLDAAADLYQLSYGLYQKLNDPRDQALTLSNLGLIYAQQDKIEAAKEKLSMALKVLGEISDPGFETRVLLILGRAYALSGENREGLTRFQQALDKSREAGNRSLEAEAWGGIGACQSELGEYEAALSSHQEALRIGLELKDESRQMMELGDIGLAYMELGKYAETFEFDQKALAIAVRLKDKGGEQMIVNNIGVAYLRLGSLGKAAEYIERAERISRERKDRRSIALMEANLGAVYARIKQFDKAIAYFEEALPVLRELKEYKFIVIANYYYGTIRRDRGEIDKAISLHTESIDVARFAHTPKFEARARIELGLDHIAQKRSELAITDFQTALITAREVGAREEESAALDGLMQAYDIAGQKGLAIFYGKQSVNLLQAIRGDIKKFDKDIQVNYVKDNERTYRRLADTLVSEGRLPEAQQVLAMLKEEELSGFVRRDSKEIENLSKRSELRANERAALDRYNLIAGKVASLGTELADLEDKKRHLPAGQTFAEQARLDELAAEVKDANTAFRLFLEKELAAELGSEKKKEIEADRALQGKLRQWGEGTVALSTIVGDDRYRVILTTPTVQVDGKTEIRVADLNRKIFAFRQALLNPSIDPRPLGKELYDILIKPIEKDLYASGAKTLLWSLDGTLRYIPMNALWDGKQYLVQKYRNVIVTSTTRQSLQAAVNNDWRVLGGGVTKASQVTDPNTTQKVSFDELKGVAGELSSIIADDGSKGLCEMPGTKLLDAAFNEDALKQELSQTLGDKRKFNVVHFATHFRLGNDTSDSFLLLGNNKILSLAEIADTPEIDLTDVELVTLSACNTGFGGLETKGDLAQKNGKEIDSLAQFIELRGARSVMASLWPVVDESTARLMSEFYRLKKEDPSLSKAEALRQAQIELLTGQIKADGNAGNGKGKRSDPITLDDEGATMPKFTPDPAKPFAHPHYWASFVLIGNWR